jgi:Protein of unknown function (DUF4239)
VGIHVVAMNSVFGLGIAGHLLLLGLVVLVGVAIAYTVVSVADRVLDDRIGPQHNSTLSPFLTVVGLVFGALLGFTVVVSWEQFSSASANVSHEASTLTTMYRQTVAMPDPERSQLREQLHKYAKAVEGPDWETLDSTGKSDNARTAIAEMYRVMGSQPNASSNPVNGEFLSQLTVLANDRNQRVLDAQPRIPPLLWGGLIFGGLVLVGLSGFMRLNHRIGHVILSSAVAILLGLLLFIVYWLDHPFGTRVGVTPEPFRNALAVFDLVDQGK